MNKPKLLIVTPTFPYPVDAGGRIAQFFIIDYLKSFFDITLISPQVRKKHILQFKSNIPEVSVKVMVERSGEKKGGHFHEIKKKILSYLPNNPEKKYFLFGKNTWANVNQPFLAFLKKINFSEFDVVQFDFLESAPLLKHLEIKVPTFLVHHELRFVRCERELNLMSFKNIEEKEGATNKLKAIKKLELDAIDLFDNIITFSEADKQFLLNELTEKSVFVSPFAPQVNCDQTIETFIFQNKVVYLGGESHHPNVDAIEWFLENIWIDLVKKRPQCSFYISGNWTKRTTNKFKKYPNVVFTGFVEDLKTLLEGSILAVPLRVGSGIRTKILEAFAMRTPVITTEIGIEGILAENNVHCIIENDTKRFCTKLLKMMSPTSQLERHIENAFDLYLSQYTIEKCGKKRLEILKEILKTEPIN